MNFHFALVTTECSSAYLVVLMELVSTVVTRFYLLVAVNLPKDLHSYKVKIPDMKNKRKSTISVIKEKVNGINMVALMEDTWQILK